MFPTRRVAWVFALLAVGIIGAGSLALAQFPSGSTIFACASSRTGDLRVIDPAVSSCRAGEQELSWDRRGSVSGYEVVTTTASNSTPAGAIFEIEAVCPTPKRPLGGGWRQQPVPDNGVQLSVQDSYPTPAGWAVRAFLRSGVSLTVLATCATSTP